MIMVVGKVLGLEMAYEEILEGFRGGYRDVRLCYNTDCNLGRHTIAQRVKEAVGSPRERPNHYHILTSRQHAVD